jgi:hypothetical protein
MPAVRKDGFIADSTATRYEVTHFHRAFARLIDMSRPVADFDRLCRRRLHHRQQSMVTFDVQVGHR